MLEKEIMRSARATVAQWEIIEAQMRRLQKKEDDVISKLKSLKAMYEMLTGKELHLPIPKFLDSPEPQPTHGPNAKLGDAIEAILSQEEKPLKTRDIVERLQQRGVKLSLNNPRNVVSMTIKRDKQKRFVMLEDKRIALREGR